MTTTKKELRPEVKLIPNDDFAKKWKEFSRNAPWISDYSDLPLVANYESLCSAPLLSREREAYLFRQMNALKYGMNLLRHDRHKWKRLRYRFKVVHHLLIQANLRLVARYIADKPGLSLDEHFTEGVTFIMKAVDAFDYSRGFKFSTYATWALLRGFGRQIGLDQKNKSRYRQPINGRLPQKSYEEADPLETLNAPKVLNRLMTFLKPEEQDLVLCHIGALGKPKEAVKDTEARYGFSGEHIRKIRNAALETLRAAAAELYPEEIMEEVA